MRMDNFDLNLLVALEILLEERGVTRAAKRLNLTQSAMSACLKRLREALQDELFVLHGKRMVPTQRALALEPEVKATLQQLRGVIAAATGFDPETSRRLFRVSASDYITTVLLAPMMRDLEREAPHVRLDLTLPNTETTSRLDAGEIDLHISPDTFIETNHPMELLFEEDHVIVGCKTNPIFDSEVTEDAYLASSHVAVRVFDRHTFIESILESRFPERKVEVVGQSFIQAPWLVAGTMRLTVMYRRLANATASILGLKIAEVPFELPAMRQMMQHHSTRSNDTGLIWFKDHLRRHARRV
jgi:DNA-binding transcriptional LysR family regulator